jgi:tetratricopeptide (TPR) repeat protein
LFIFLTVALNQNPDYVAIRKQGMSEYRARHYGEAQQALEKALAAAEQANDLYEVALTSSALGDVYQQELRFKEAEHSYRKGVAILLREPGRTHALAIMWRNLASVLVAETRYQDALAALDEASRLVRVNGLQDAQLKAEILNSRGTIYFYQRRWSTAKKYFLRAIQETTGGYTEDLTTEGILNNLARAYHNSGEQVKAEETYKRAITLAEARLGPSHLNLVAMLTNLAALCNDLGRFDEAEGYFQRSLGILEKSGTMFDETQMMEALHGLGKTHMGKHDAVRAEPLLKRASAIARQNLNQSIMIPEILRILDDYSKVLRELQNPNAADDVHAEAQRIRATSAFTVRANPEYK